MITEYPLYGKPCSLALTINSEKPTDFSLLVGDAEKEDVVFTDRTGKLNGSKTYYVRMPISPDIAIIEIEGKQSDVYIEDIQVMELPTDFSSPLFKRKDVQSFIEFAEEFSYDAGILEPNRNYYSDDEVYEIKYLRSISENGKSLETPARISQKTGLIEVDRQYFLSYTIPMRIAILLHEFAHFYLNEVMEDEVEADRNSLILYMGMGYPRIDAYNVYLDVFEETPTEQNLERYNALQKLFKYKYVA